MATALVRKLLPGVTVRTGVKGKTIRFDAMIKGNRFVGTSQLPISMAIDPKGRPTQELKVEYAKWRAQQEIEKIGPENVGLRVPNIQELIDTYEQIAWERYHSIQKQPTPRTIETAIKNFGYCVEASGLAPSRPITELFAPNMLRKIWDVFCTRKSKNGKNLTGVTAFSYITALQSVTPSWAIAKYYNLGLEVSKPNIETVDIGTIKQAPKYMSLPQEQVDKIMMWYETLEEKLGSQCRLAALLSLKLAIRPGDAVNLTLENFPVVQGRRRLVYKPAKTYHRTKRGVDVAIAPALWEEIERLVGDVAPGERIIKTRSTTYQKLNQSIRYACDMRIEDGWDKATYELRKLCLDLIWHDPMQGPNVAVALSGDRQTTLENFYTDPHSTDREIG